MLKSLANLLFPKACCGCDGLLLESETTICTQCRHDMPFTSHYRNAENETYNKFLGRLPLEHASSMVYFHKKGIVQELIHNLKYRGKEEVGALMGQWYAQDLATALTTIDAVIPVPLHKKKLRERGYNQVAGFGKALSEGLEAEYSDTLLLRKTYTKTQTNKNIMGRTDIIATTFEADFTEADSGKHFLLVDDVITTGATLEACGRALLKIPGARLSIVTIAYAHS
ncbi:MAG: ComF family protein [Flavobacterium sp.]|nr:MAG: ComF family protein [Flavobacterium sp.]